jgi:hypothetical protein
LAVAVKRFEGGKLSIDGTWRDFPVNKVNKPRSDQGMISLKHISDGILQGEEFGKIIQIGMICQNGMR